jgi:class 3 adenylate cyclase/tetratricopeptide (TPR) repeat protein
VIVCANCGTQNPDGFKFCGNCAAPLGAAQAPREQRKVVSVLFCDVTGSTAMGETADPETLRALLARYFDRMKGIVESHGGTVEKFIGDAVMAVFGVPQVHEDDALRAVRAALEMRDALPELGIQARIGVNTGEVVTGTQERLATGDAVNVAARLEQAAQAGQILIGRDTYELVESVVEAQEIEPLAVKGKSQPVAADLLHGLTGSPARRNEARMVGRSTELRRLRDAYDQAVRDRSCQLFTVLGNAGVGKSRVVHEFLDGIDATVVSGICLSYGDGITYWPVIEVISQLVQRRPGLELDRDLASLMGDKSFTPPSEQIAWSFRKLLEASAQDRPLVVVFDDIQWAEPTFLDLIEHVADLSRDAPILLLCMARPDLLDRRPTWGGGKLNATSLLLEPLSGAESAAMVEALVGGLSAEASQRVVEAAEGNPLFVEEMVALVRESNDENVRIPPSIQALLAARLDQLDESEREVLERGSIEGRLFHRGAIEALYPEESHVASRLIALVRKDLVRPDKAELPGEDAFRFRHLLIRDAAYDALPKATRADLHERFAAWLEEFGADLPELDEILGYHFEQGLRYRQELGQTPNPKVADKARERLMVAGLRAFRRGDHRAASNLLGRADNLPGMPEVAIQKMHLMSTLFGGDGRRALELAQEHVSRAEKFGDQTLELCSRMDLEFIRTFVEPFGALERLRKVTAEAAAIFEPTDNLSGMYIVYQSRMEIANMMCDVATVMTNLEAVIDAGRRLGIDNQFIPPLANWRVLSSEPNSESLEWFETEAAGYHAGVDEHRAEALAMAGRFDEARACLQNELRIAAAMVGDAAVGGIEGFAAARVEMLAGDVAAAAVYGERGCEALVRSGNPSVASTAAGIAARANFYAGNSDQAEYWADRAVELGAPEDLQTQLMAAQARGLVAAGRGDADGTERHFRAAIEMATSTHSPLLLGDAYTDMAEAMALLGNRDAAIEAFREALGQSEAKENVALAAHVRQRLADLNA